MKVNNVKISSEDLEVLRKLLGVKRGILNFENGVFRVFSNEEVYALSERFTIDNVNWKPFDEFNKTGETLQENSAKNEEGEEGSEKKMPEAPEEDGREQKKASEYSIEERNEIIGIKIKQGSIVRIKVSEKTIHLLITKTSKEEYQGYKMVLGTEGYNPDTDVLLKKGEDVIYRNLTYKALVRVTSELITGVTKGDFIYGQAGLIVGRVINKEKLETILNMQSSSIDREEPMVQSQLSQEIATEDSPSEPEKPALEDYLDKAGSLEEFLGQTGLIGTVLETAIKLCIENKHSNMKKLLPMLQEKAQNKRLTQNALKSQMNDELAKWCENSEYSIKEETVAYLLKLTVKRFKN